MNTQMLNSNAIFETWAPTIEKTTQIVDKDKLKWMSKMAHVHQLYEDVYNNAHVNPEMNVPGMGSAFFPGNPGLSTAFSTQTAGSGDKPYTLLPLSMQVAAQTIGLDLVPVVQMAGPLGMMTYLDYVYAGGQLSSKEAPLVIKVPVAMGSGTPLVSGTTYYIKSGAAVTTVSYQFTYIADSRIDGYPIFKVVPTNSVDGLALSIGAEARKSINAAITADAIYVAAASGTSIGAFDGDAELVKALEDHIPGFSGRSLRLDNGVDNKNEPYLREEGEREPESMMGLTLRSQSVSAGTKQVAIAITREQIEDLRQYGIDAIAQAETAAANELTQSLNSEILERIAKTGATSHTRWFASQGENFNVNMNSTAQTIQLGNGITGSAVSGMLTRAVNTSLGGESVATLQRTVYAMILGASNAINNHTRRGNGNFVVTNHQVGSALQSIAGFTAYPMNNSISQNSGSLYQLGSIAGVNVYVDPNMGWSDTRIIVGRKGDNNSTGLVFCPYIMAASTSIIAESTMAPKIAVKSRYALVDAGHYPEDNYMTLKIQMGDVLPTLLG